MKNQTSLIGSTRLDLLLKTVSIVARRASILASIRYRNHLSCIHSNCSHKISTIFVMSFRFGKLCSLCKWDLAIGVDESAPSVKSFNDRFSPFKSGILFQCDNIFSIFWLTNYYTNYFSLCSFASLQFLQKLNVASFFNPIIFCIIFSYKIKYFM